MARLFRRLHVVELITDAGRVWRRSALSKEQKVILQQLGVAPPKEIQKVHLKS